MKTFRHELMKQRGLHVLLSSLHRFVLPRKYRAIQNWSLVSQRSKLPGLWKSRFTAARPACSKQTSSADWGRWSPQSLIAAMSGEFITPTEAEVTFYANINTLDKVAW